MSIGRTPQVVHLRAIPRNSTPAAARFQDETKLAKLKGAECDRISILVFIGTLSAAAISAFVGASPTLRMK
jgi:hypothetical protein